MDNSDIVIWQLKHTQTDSFIKSEERRLERVNRELNAEKTKFQSLKESFQRTKERLLLLRKNNQNPAAALTKSNALKNKLTEERKEMEGVNARLSLIEGKIKKQSVQVLQNKKKLEILDRRIAQLMYRKNSKEVLRQELEILDGKIIQLVNRKNQMKESSISEFSLEASGAEEVIGDLVCSEIEQVSEKTFCDFKNAAKSEECGKPLFGGSSNERSDFAADRQPHESRSDCSSERQKQNQDFYRKIHDLKYSKGEQAGMVSLRFLNSSGHAFDLEIQKDNKQGYKVFIFAHSKIDSRILKFSQQEILETLRGQGIRVNGISIRGGEAL